MIRRWVFGLLLVVVWVGGKSAKAADESFSGKFSVEAGSLQAPGGSLQPFQFSRLLVEGRNDLSSNLSYGLSAEADWQTAALGSRPPWPLYPQKNAVVLEDTNLSSSDGSNVYSARVNRVYLKWVSGSVEATAGLQSFNWGISRFYRPTNYFFPCGPLDWTRDQPLGSEALDASCFLFDDLSLEGAARLLEGGTAEEVLRLVNKGIGLTVTPSFAWMKGRNGLGLEAMGTLPDFQVRLEGVDWLYPDGHAAAEWVVGLSTVKDGTTYTLEAFRDETGNMLGFYSSAPASQATYVSASVEKDFTDGWKVSPSLAFSLEGGPLLFWPKASWGFSTHWELEFEAQIQLGRVAGPLALNPGRAGLSVSYSF
ncbi:MAG TPA: hypothetical protein VIJ93_09075 [bacterium]